MTTFKAKSVIANPEFGQELCLQADLGQNKTVSEGAS